MDVYVLRILSQEQCILPLWEPCFSCLSKGWASDTLQPLSGGPVARDLIDQFADLVLGADDPRQLGLRTLEVVVAMNGGRSAAIFKRNRDRLTLFVSHSIDQAVLDAVETIWRRYRDGLERGEVFYSPDFRADKRFAGSAGEEQRSAGVAVVPVFDGDAVVALLYVDSKSPRFCGPEEIERLQKFGRIVAKAVGYADGVEPALTGAAAEDAVPEPALVRGSREELLYHLSRHEWNIARVSRILGVTRRTIYLRLARFKVRREKVLRGERAARLRPGTAPA